MKTHATHSRTPALLLAVLLALASPALLGQTQTEGYDPMRQITAQLMKANLHIVQDVTGSMERWPDSSDEPVGKANAFGYLIWSGPSKSCSDSKCRYWYYDLTFEAPSRMAILKNALGDSIPLVTSYTPPAVASPWTRAAPNPNTNSKKVWRFTYDYGSGRTGSDPKAPFSPYETITIPGAYTSSTLATAYTVANFPKVVDGACTVGTCTYYPPQDLVGRNAGRVNWGLTKYSTDGVSTLVYIDTADTNKHLARIEAYLTPSGAYTKTKDRWGNTIRGLAAGGSTNTRAGLTEAKEVLRDDTYPDDPKKGCDRPYGVILVTDGQSNSGNGSACGLSDGSWSSCPSNWWCYPAGVANEIYNVLNRKPKVNTWVIGVSAEVGACELDFTAYAGRTDAASPRGDAGFSGYAAPTPPPPAVATDPGNPYVAEPVPAAGTFSSHYNTAHGHNAFFATSASALADAITAIVNATATGDYATNAPVSGMSASLSSVVYLPSTEFPSWKGHLYAYDTKYKPNEDEYLYVEWDPKDHNASSTRPLGDAAEILNERSPGSRKIFTWNPSTKALVEVTTANLATLVSLGGATVTADVVKWIRGEDIDLNGDGDTADPGEKRTWRLGPLINSAPAIVGAPATWLQGTTMSHKPFESQYAGRDALLWVGSNHGMMHAFRVADGVEQIALLPPSLLSKQAEIFDAYKKDPRNPKNPAGQSGDTNEHVYGVANSFRFGDVWDDSTTTPAYRTIGILTTGPGGDDLVAVDVTQVPKPDAASYPADPVKVLWTRDGTTLPGLQQSWSIPAMGPAKSDTWRLIMGSGFRPENTRTAQTTNTDFVQPNAFTLDPTDGSILSTVTLTSTSSYSPFVGSQAFADTVFLNPYSKFYQDDNIASLAMQADLNGQIWFLTSNNATQLKFDTKVVGINVSAKAGQSQPIYYNPAASGYGQGGAGCVAYAFGSGALYERSSQVTGAAVGTTGFIPTLYVATAQKASFSSALSNANITAKRIYDPTAPWKLQGANGTETDIVFGPKTQLTAPPYMLVPRNVSGTSTVTALFLLYDPDKGCKGNSYVAQIDFIGGDTCQPTNATTFKAHDAGEGAASGFTVAGSRVLVSKSGVGEGQRASLYEPPNIAASIGNLPEVRVKWWKELK